MPFSPDQLVRWWRVFWWTGGFTKEPDLPSALVVIYASDLEAAQDRVEEAGGTVTRPIFAFPGGRRFHFRDPVGNELAVWSDAERVS